MTEIANNLIEGGAQRSASSIRVHKSGVDLDQATSDRRRQFSQSALFLYVLFPARRVLNPYRLKSLVT
jgi:hypothetical protein